MQDLSLAETYDSACETCEHILEVQRAVDKLVWHLVERAENHDQSKLGPVEKPLFDAYVGRLQGCTYGSDEYRENLAGLKPALDHHYAVNSHHPEHHKNGVRGMNLVEVVEMFCDWHASSKRHADGDLHRSIDINQGRFGYGDDLKAIFHNTADLLAV
jgi:hypothetical protein